jgi:diaminopimelate epimerase
MPELRFHKYQGLGNDFIIVDSRKSNVMLTADAAKRLCDRRRGIGADGVITLLAPRIMHVYNSDGSVPEMCGNGLRCVVHLLGGNGTLQIETGAGIREGVIVGPDSVRVTLAKASVIVEPFTVTVDEPKEAIGVSMGNPHLILRPFQRNQDLFALAKRFGPSLERHPKFPERTNVELASIVDTKTIRLVVYERGAGITDACGTGAGACAYAMRKWGLVESTGPIRVELPGGPLEVEIDDQDRVAITGEAKRVFTGSTSISQMEILSGDSSVLLA